MPTDIESILSASDGYLASIGQSRHCRIWQCGGDGDITWPTYRQSTDGKTWTNLPPQHLPPASAMQPGQLLSDGQTFLVIDFHGRTWSSTDGLDWQPNPVYVPDAATAAASDSLRFGCSNMALGTSGLAHLEWDGQSTTISWFATFSAAPAASALRFPSQEPVPEEVALLDPIHYSCLGSSPPSILWQTGYAEQGTGPKPPRLRAIVTGGDPKIGSEGADLPDTGWHEVAARSDSVLYIHSGPPPHLEPIDTVSVKRAADGSWGFGGLTSGGRCIQHNEHGSQTDSAAWRLRAQPSPNDKRLLVEVQLLSCGHPTPDQIVPRPTAFYGRDAIDILFSIPPIDTGDVACYRWYPFTITLDHPIGNRALFDAARLPLVQRWPK